MKQGEKKHFFISIFEKLVCSDFGEEQLGVLKAV